MHNYFKIFILKTLLLMVIFQSEGLAQKPSPALLTPVNHTLVIVDIQDQMVFATKSISISELRDNVGLVAGVSRIFNIPTIVTTAARSTFSGPVIPEVKEYYADESKYIDRTNMNTWEDAKAYKAIIATGKKKIVFAGLWTEVCIVDPVLSAINEGFEVYFVTDASGGVSREAHEMAVRRMIQVGGQPITSTQYVLELQRDWARQETYKAVTELLTKYGSTYGIGIQYAKDMLKK